MKAANVRFIDVHILNNETLADGLKSLGLLIHTSSAESTVYVEKCRFDNVVYKAAGGLTFGAVAAVI